MSDPNQTLLPTDFEILSKGEALRRYPGFRDACDDWDKDYEIDQLLLFKGDRRIGSSWRTLLERHEAEGFLIEGDVELDWDWPQTLWCTGRLRCDSVSLKRYTYIALGGIEADYGVRMDATDNEIGRMPPRMRVDTPYLYAWFYQVQPLRLSPETVIFQHRDSYRSDFASAGNVLFPWHDSIHALDDAVQQEIQNDPDDFSYSQTCWHDGAIKRATRDGRSIWRAGFDPEAREICDDALAELEAGDPKRAWLIYREAARRSPGYYPAMLQLGRLLFRQGAFRQAEPYLLLADALFPAKQRWFRNEAAGFAASAALRLDRPRLALARLRRAVRPLVDAWPDDVPYLTRHMLRRAEPKPHPDFIYLTGQALWLVSRPDHPEYCAETAEFERAEAKALISLAVEHPKHASFNWLMGLMLYHEGDFEGAEAYRQKAIALFAEYDVSYEDHKTVAFLLPSATEVDWEEARLDTPWPPQDEAWWRAELRYNPPRLRYAPAAVLTGELLAYLIEHQPEYASLFVHYFPASAYTPELARRLVERDAANLRHLPAGMVDRSLCLAAVPGKGVFPAADLPRHCFDREVCAHALRCGVSLRQLPIERLDDELWHVAMAHGGADFVDRDVPRRLQTRENFKRLLDESKTALEAIPGRWFDQDLFEHAESLYGKDPDWKAMVAQHGPRVCTDRIEGSFRDYHDFARRCWLALWDEEAVIEKLEADEDEMPLSPADIPAGQYTPAVVEACLAAHPASVGCIPERLIGEHAALALMEEHPLLLGELPLSLRSVEVCFTAVLGNGDASEHVPTELFAEVFERVAAVPDSGFYSNWLLVQRGLACLLSDPPRVDEAMALFEEAIATAPAAEPAGERKILVYSDGEEVEEEDSGEEASDAAESDPGLYWVNGARFLLAHCLYRQGEPERARPLWQASGLAEDEAACIGYDPFDGMPQGGFERRDFAAWLADADKLLWHANTYPEAEASLAEAEKLLTEGACWHPVRWAELLGRRLRLADAGRGDALAVCHEIARRLGAQRFWVYAHTPGELIPVLRSAWHRLAEQKLARRGEPDVAALEEGLRLIEKALALEDKGNGSWVYHPLYDTYLSLLRALSERLPDSDYPRLLTKACVAIRSLPWREFIYSPELLALLAEEEAEAD